FGLTDEPLHVQYFTYVKNLLRGDLGTSIAYFPAPVSEVIGKALLWTLFLAGLAVLVSFALGTLLGILTAWKRGSWLDSVAPSSRSLGAFPYFWMARALLYALGFVGGWFPLLHAHSSHLRPCLSLEFIGDALHRAVLPAGSIVIASLGGWLLSMRNTIIGVLP